jgi:hypothetical protein
MELRTTHIHLARKEQWNVCDRLQDNLGLSGEDSDARLVTILTRFRNPLSDSKEKDVFENVDWRFGRGPITGAWIIYTRDEQPGLVLITWTGYDPFFLLYPNMTTSSKMPPDVIKPTADEDRLSGGRSEFEDGTVEELGYVPVYRRVFRFAANLCMVIALTSYGMIPIRQHTFC